MDRLRFTVLVENTAESPGLMAEHGLAIWIEMGSRRVLFDAGQTDVIRHNAARLGIDPGAAEVVVLSHGHYDHSGGLATVLRDAAGARVFAHPEALGEKYVRGVDGTARDIGMSRETRKRLRKVAEITFTERPTTIGDGISVTGPIPRLGGFEDTGGAFFKDAACRRPDNLIDDQALFIDSPAGTVVILGCAHAGLINTLRYVRTLLPARPIHAVIGGTHLVSADKTRVDRTVETLREFEIRHLMPQHCTGRAVTERLAKEFPGRVRPAPAGCRIEL